MLGVGEQKIFWRARAGRPGTVQEEVEAVVVGVVKGEVEVEVEEWDREGGEGTVGREAMSDPRILRLLVR